MDNNRDHDWDYQTAMEDYQTAENDADREASLLIAISALTNRIAELNTMVAPLMDARTASAAR